ncbi:MAG: hypothetical protein SF162_10235 [bacterium]|nr:hypothetical protein [bacterium]
MIDVVFAVLSAVAIGLGAVRIVHYDLAFQIEIALKRAVRMRLPVRTPQWENNSRFTGILLMVLGVLNLIALVGGR